MSEPTILHFEEIDSTNAYFKRTWESQPEFAFAFASHQTLGKGRERRQWLDEPGKNCLCSVLIKRPSLLVYGGFLSLVAATAVGCVLENLGIDDVSIKWPNDVYVQGKKICGILLEGQLPNYLVLGIGINVNQREFSSCRVAPTSLSLVLGKTLDLGGFEAKIVAKLRYFLEVDELDPDFFLTYYRNHDYLYGKPISKGGETYIASGVDDHFRLLGENSRGETFAFVSGEVDPIG